MITQTKTTWRKVKLGEVIGKVIDNRGKTPPLSKSGYKLIETFQMSRNFKFPDVSNSDKQKFVSENTYETWFRSGHPQEGDILFSTVGASIPQWSFMPKGTKYCIAQNLIALRPDKNKIMVEYLRYYFNQKRFIKQVEGIIIGAAQPSIKVPHLLGLEIEITGLTDQKRIADILSAFDDKIELNNKISWTLEQMAQAIFKEWFTIKPSDSKSVPLTEMADFVNGGAFGKIVNHNRKGLPLVKIAEFSRGITENTEWIDVDVSKKYLLKNGDLLFSWSGSLDLHIWHKGDAVLNQHLFNVVPRDPYTKGLLYVVLRSMLPWFRQIAQSKATSMGHIQRRHLEEQEIIIPSDKKLSIFEDIYGKLVALMVENRKLAALRDLLLPKLMGGEIAV